MAVNFGMYRFHCSKKTCVYLSNSKVTAYRFQRCHAYDNNKCTGLIIGASSPASTANTVFNIVQVIRIHSESGTRCTWYLVRSGVCTISICCLIALIRAVRRATPARMEYQYHTGIWLVPGTNVETSTSRFFSWDWYSTWYSGVRYPGNAYLGTGISAGTVPVLVQTSEYVEYKQPGPSTWY